MIDNFERKIDYLRISVTDRCNLRCSYCMPKGVQYKLSHDDILSFEQIIELSDIFYRLGIRKVKITGGEPLVREDVCDLIQQLKKKFDSVTLTTNGVLIEKYYEQLKKCNLDGINISVDSLDKNKYEETTGFDKLDEVKKGIELAKTLTTCVKINTVLLHSDIIDIVSLTKYDNLIVRFIEVMPIGKATNILTNEMAKKIIEERFGKLQISDFSSNGPSKYYELKGFVGKIGFISPISDIFCDKCNKIRLLANGQLKTCLSFSPTINLKKMLDNNSREEIEKAIYNEILAKPKSHNFLTDREIKSGMNEIGG